MANARHLAARPRKWKAAQDVVLHALSSVRSRHVLNGMFTKWRVSAKQIASVLGERGLGSGARSDVLYVLREVVAGDDAIQEVRRKAEIGSKPGHWLDQQGWVITGCGKLTP